MDSTQVEQNLFQLLTVVEEQQKAATKAITALGQEREKIAKEREEIRATINSAVKAALASAGEAALKDSAKALSLASSKVRTAAQWLSFQVVGAALAGLLLVAFIGFGFMEWKQYEYQSLVEKTKRLEDELPVLEAQAAHWEEKAGRATLSRCGPKKKPCARVNPDAGTFGDKRLGETYYILDGY